MKNIENEILTDTELPVDVSFDDDDAEKPEKTKARLDIEKRLLDRLTSGPFFDPEYEDMEI